MLRIVRASFAAIFCVLTAGTAYPERPIRLIVPFTFYMSTFASALPHVKGGRLRAYAVTTTKRAEPLPDVPTVAEEAVPDFEYAAWYGLFAPTGTPRPVIDKVHAAAVGALKLPQVLQLYKAQGLHATPTTPAEFRKYFAAEKAKWAAVVREAKISPQ